MILKIIHGGKRRGNKEQFTTISEEYVCFMRKTVYLWVFSNVRHSQFRVGLDDMAKIYITIYFLILVDTI